MQRREPPATEEGWYVLHDLRRVDWDAWRGATERERERALSDGIEYLESHEALADAEAGGSAVFAVVGHEADLMMLHLRPTTAALDRAGRAFEGTAFAEYTERASSYVSVTEVSGYVTEELADGLDAVESEGTRNYLEQRLYPTIPDTEHVCFYPMDKRRGPEDNWYDLPFDERAELIEGHGDVGREYAGKVTQIITGSLGFDDHEWGVTLFADDPTDIKQLLYEMRFDPSSSRYAEFGPFSFGRRLSPADLPKFIAGDPLPAYGGSDGDRAAGGTSGVAGASGDDPGTGEESQPASGGTTDEGTMGAEGATTGRPPQEQGEAPHQETDRAALERELRRVGFDPDDYADAGYGLVVHSDADAEAVVDDVEGLRENFDHYDTHVETAVRADAGRTAVVSLWANERAADTASGFLFDLPGVDGGVGAPLSDDRGESLGDGSEAGTPPSAPADDTPVEGTDDDPAIREELAGLDIYAGQPHGEDVYALVLYSGADVEELAAEVASIAEGFDRYDTHLGTEVYEGADADRAAVVSLWETRDAAGTAGEYLAELPDVVARAGEGDGFGTMGMFYTIKPDRREEFLERFETVGELLGEMEGHRNTDLLVNVEDDADMFIASEWASKDDAMAFFRSEAFRDTVKWGREVLTDRPRHVFLA